MNPQTQESPEKKKRKKVTTSPPPTPPSFSLLPDEIIENCLARVPRSYYPKLSLVSKNFRSILSSTDICAARSRLGSTQQCIYVCLRGLDSSHNNYFQWITFSINPNRTKTKKKKNTIRKLSVLIPSSNVATWGKPTVVGYEIYVIGGSNAPSSAVRVLDCRSHIWHDAPNMNVSRKNPVSCLYNGKIYVTGGTSKLLEDGTSRLLEDESWGEVFDIKTQTWERFPRPDFEIRNRFYYKIIELRGKIYFKSGYVCKNAYAYYDPTQCKWECKGAPWPGCVMDTVSYSFRWHGGRYKLLWRDINGSDNKEVKGVDSLGKRFERHGVSPNTSTKVTSCGGKLYVIWQSYTNKICCAEISLEKHDGNEMCGDVVWFDVVHTTPTQCHLLHCLAISL